MDKYGDELQSLCRYVWQYIENIYSDTYTIRLGFHLPCTGDNSTDVGFPSDILCPLPKILAQEILFLAVDEHRNHDVAGKSYACFLLDTARISLTHVELATHRCMLSSRLQK